MSKDITNKLTYDNLKLGEKGVEMYKVGASIEEIQKESAVYLNTSEDYLGLNTTDYIAVGILTGGNTLLAGRSGCGKSQVADDIARHYFGGSIDSEGRALVIEGDPELRIMEDVFTDIDKVKAKRVLNSRNKANYINMEELNRCPPFTQNQFFALLNKRLIYEGKTVDMGEGYCPTISTVNLGNGDYKGTFDSDLALYNRFGMVLNLDENEFSPTGNDTRMLKLLRPADSGIKKSKTRDITDLLRNKNKEIKKSSIDLGTEAEAVLEFIEYGLSNCSENGKKDVDWGSQNRSCQGCDKNTQAPTKNSICSLVQSPVQRTLNNIRLYSAGIDNMLKLKGIEDTLAKDIVFRAFELTAPYSGVLNPYVAQQSFDKKNSLMMKDVVEEIKKEYNENENRIIAAMESSKKGTHPSSLFFITKPGINNPELRTGIEKITKEYRGKLEANKFIVDTESFDFNDKSEIGYSWVEDSADFNIQENKRKNK